MTKEIVVIGSLNMDMVVRVQRRPDKGETVLGQDFMMSPGGKGANQAYSASKLGGHVTMIGCLGDDVFAETLKEKLLEGGVDTNEIIVTDKAKSGTAFISIDQDGDNSIIVAPGANQELTTSFIKEKEEVIKHAKLLILQLEIPIESVLEAVLIARKHNVPVLLDPAPVCELPDELLRNIDYITPNQVEIYHLTGIEVTDVKSAQVAAIKLIEKGVKTVFAKMGEKGVAVINSNRTSYVEGYKVNVVDTTAAGDSFAGAVGLALVKGMDEWEAAHFGNAVGALTVTRPGAQASIPTREEVDEFIKNIGEGS
jgi:ribokinase